MNSKFATHKSPTNVVLTEQEHAVLLLICKELTMEEIAAQTGKAIPEIESIRNDMLEKTSCRNSAGLVLFAINQRMFNYQSV